MNKKIIEKMLKNRGFEVEATERFLWLRRSRNDSWSLIHIKEDVPLPVLMSRILAKF